MVAGGSGVKSQADGDMVSGGCYLPWPSELWGPDVPVKTTDKKKITALHCSMPQWCSKRALAGSHLRTQAPQFILSKL